MKRTKKDKQFMIQFDQANRDSVINMSMFLLSILISVTALMASAFSIVFSITGFGLYSIGVLVVFIIILVPFWVTVLPYAKRGIKNSKKVNEQLQKMLYELYPEYKEKYH